MFSSRCVAYVLRHINQILCVLPTEGHKLFSQKTHWGHGPSGLASIYTSVRLPAEYLCQQGDRPGLSQPGPGAALGLVISSLKSACHCVAVDAVSFPGSVITGIQNQHMHVFAYSTHRMVYRCCSSGQTCACPTGLTPANLSVGIPSPSCVDLMMALPSRAPSCLTSSIYRHPAELA